MVELQGQRLAFGRLGLLVSRLPASCPGHALHLWQAAFSAPPVALEGSQEMMS